ncbi:hypothetical protein [Arthrobacter rhizosphaerae]|nr:hypothetical protein [Arthrobacter rhizosphaerae]
MSAPVYGSLMWRQSGGQRAAEPVEAVLGPILDFGKVDVKALGPGNGTV